MTAIGVDIGGTNVRVALVDRDGTVVEQGRAATPVGDAAALARVVGRLVGEYDDDLPVGVGIAGAVDGEGLLSFGPNLRMAGQAIRGPFAEAIGRTPVIANDASVGAWGEHVVGAGRGHDDVVLVTIGTGVGGGVVTGGQLLVGGRGAGGELGHVIVRADGDVCTCGNRGCLEAYSSGRHYGTAERSPAETVEAARSGDDGALAHVNAAARWLGIGIHGFVAAFDPTIVLVGGGAGQAVFDLVADTVRTTLAGLLVGRGHRSAPPVERAALGDDAGVVGAALLALARADRATAGEES